MAETRELQDERTKEQIEKRAYEIYLRRHRRGACPRTLAHGRRRTEAGASPLELRSDEDTCGSAITQIADPSKGSLSCPPWQAIPLLEAGGEFLHLFNANVARPARNRLR